MRHTFQVQVIAVLLTAATVLATDHRLFAAGPTPPSTTKPSYPSTTTPGPIDRAYMLHPYMPQGPSPAMPMLSPQNMAAAMEKLRSLGTQIGRALDVAVRLLSGNEVDFVSRNKTNLLSGNAPEILSGNKPNLLSGNAPKLLSGNKMPILSGNSFSMFSNIKVEIHIYNANNGNNNNITGNTAQPHGGPAGPNPGPARTPPLKK